MSRRNPLPWPYEGLFDFTLLDAAICLVEGMVVGVWVLFIAIVAARVWG